MALLHMLLRGVTNPSLCPGRAVDTYAMLRATIPHHDVPYTNARWNTSIAEVFERSRVWLDYSEYSSASYNNGTRHGSSDLKIDTKPGVLYIHHDDLTRGQSGHARGSMAG